MKKIVRRFPKKTVKNIIQIMINSSNNEEINSKLAKKYLFNQEQIDFILSFSKEDLESEEYYDFSPFYSFINVLTILDSDKNANRCAVLINKKFGRLYVYDKAVQETKPCDSYFNYLDQIHDNDKLRLIFTNSGIDRYYLDVLNPESIVEDEQELKIEKAFRIIWNGLYHISKNETTPFIITFELNNRIVTESTEYMNKKTIRRY